MEKTTIVLGICAVIWLAVLSIAFTGYAIHSNSCCIGQNCPPDEQCHIQERSPFSIQSTILMVILLFSGIGFIYYNLKI
ncbi:MAG: hypothetical protein ACMXYG_05095 [Candidatus Woesearchaeota archaeon]